MDSQDCFRPANGLMHQTIEMDDETLVAADDEIHDDLVSDGEETVFEEYNEPHGIFLEQTASNADDLQVLAVLIASFIRSLTLRVESAVLSGIQHGFQIENQPFLKILIRGPILFFLANLMFTIFQDIFLGLKALVMLLGCVCLVCNSF